MTNRPIVGLLASLVLLAGCSISASSWSLSKSVRSSSRSSDSSSSSSPGAAEEAYREDVSDYTRAYVKSTGGDLSSFRAGLGRLAGEHGITNWEENSSTYTAIGEGLAKGGVTSSGLLAYKQNLSGGDPAKADLIQKGYDSAR
jgi:hypothetical protein